MNKSDSRTTDGETSGRQGGRDGDRWKQRPTGATEGSVNKKSVKIKQNSCTTLLPVLYVTLDEKRLQNGIVELKIFFFVAHYNKEHLPGDAAIDAHSKHNAKNTHATTSCNYLAHHPRSHRPARPSVTRHHQSACTRQDDESLDGQGGGKKNRGRSGGGVQEGAGGCLVPLRRRGSHPSGAPTVRPPQICLLRPTCAARCCKSVYL